MKRKDTTRLPPPPAPSRGGASSAADHARALARDAFGREIIEPQESQPADPMFGPSQENGERKEVATDLMGQRAGATLDEVDFPTFVASLVHGTFDAIVDSSIRQMESFADLVAAVSKPLSQFTQENVTRNQARDWLVEQYPTDVGMLQRDGGFTLVPLTSEDEFADAPDWLADFDLEGESLSTDLLEQNLVPAARERIARQRMSTLSTMVLLGMNRVVVKDGTIATSLKFRATAEDHSGVLYATSNDPSTGGTQWGQRASQRPVVTKVSTVEVNVQSDSNQDLLLSGNVRVNFASETLPLDRFVDEAQQALLERNSRRRTRQIRSAPAQIPAPSLPVATVPAAPVPAAPVAPAPAAPAAPIDVTPAPPAAADTGPGAT